MAMCTQCCLRPARAMLDVCEQCASEVSPAASGSVTAQDMASAFSWEADITVMLGKVLIWLSIMSSVICAFVYGRVRVPDGLYGADTVWSSTLVMVFIAAGLNGVLFGFLLQKVGSILRHLEMLRRDQ